MKIYSVFSRLNLTGILVLSLLFVLPACREDHEAKDLKISKVRIIMGENQCALPDEKFSTPIRVEVLGEKKQGYSLFNKSNPPLADIPIQFKVSPDSGLQLEQENQITDITGQAETRVVAGKKVGDQYVQIIPGHDPDKAVNVRLTVGAKVYGTDQEGYINEVLNDPISIKLVGSDQKPLVNVPVFFNIKSEPGKAGSAKVLTGEVQTNELGIAKSFVKLGDATGPYEVSIEVADPEQNIVMRSTTVRVMGIDLWKVLLSLVGGLAFLLFGMELLSNGLQKIAGDSMKKILQFFSKNSVMAVFAGALVTAIIQSSSATSVMVLGFINAGLIQLQQAIGIIFGANVGTTITAQLISFDLEAFAIPAIVLGFLLMISKKRLIKGWGECVFGFGILFFGITMMSSEMFNLSSFPTFLKFFAEIDCAPLKAGGFMPFLQVIAAIGIGILATLILQSSSAVTGIILVLAGSGLLNFYTAVPMVIGTNIGTTITAWLASLTANRVAKQAALAHSMFNVIGALIMLALFYVPYGAGKTPVFLYFVNAITPGNVFADVPQNLARHVAMAHTMFNVITVAAIIPALGLFTKLCEWILPVKSQESVQTRGLEPLLLNTPTVAIDQTISEIRKMVQLSWSMIDRAVNDHFRKAYVNKENFEELEDQEQQVDEMQSNITNYLVEITRHPLTRSQSELIPLLMHCTNDAERIADHTANIVRLTKRLAKANVKLSDIAQQDLEKLWSLLNNQSENVQAVLATSVNDKKRLELMFEDEKKVNKLAKKYEKSVTSGEAIPVEIHEELQEKMAEDARQNEEAINALTKQYEQSHIQRRNEGQCSVDANVVFIEMLWELEQIGDQLANIAQRAPEIQKHHIAH